jgi:SAM-dependent methyltransferase
VISQAELDWAVPHFGAGPSVNILERDAVDLFHDDDSLDLVLCLDTLGQVGCPDDPGATRRAVGELLRPLRPGGLLLVSFPYGTFDDLGWRVVFDARLLEAFFGHLDIVEAAFFRREGAGYRPCAQNELKGVEHDPTDPAPAGLACLAIRK